MESSNRRYAGNPSRLLRCAPGRPANGLPPNPHPHHPQLASLEEFPARSDKHSKPILRDSFGRIFTYLRVALTDRCTLRCRYCMPATGVKFMQRPELLTLEEWKRIIGIFVNLGIQKIRLTGGEPLLYPQISELIQWINVETGVNDVSLTTNGLRLALLAESLSKSGLARVNVSCDSLQVDRFRAITRGGELTSVLSGIRSARSAGLNPIKVNCVVMRGKNDDELIDFCRFAAEEKVEVRFLEMMPTEFTTGGREELITVAEMIQKIQGSGVDLIPLPKKPGETAEQYRVSGTDAVVGFIGTVTRKFCDTCNRLRILSNGFLKLCLHADGGIDLRELLRHGVAEQEIERCIQKSVWMKAWGSEFTPERYEKTSTVMSQVGG